MINLLKEKKLIKFLIIIFFTNGDSRNPEIAGIGGAMLGSFFSL